MTKDTLINYIKRAEKWNGRGVSAFIEAAGGIDEVANLLEANPWDKFAYGFKDGERLMESEVGSLMEGQGGAISASATAVFTTLGVTAAVLEAYELPDKFAGEIACYKEPSKTRQQPHAWLYRPDLPEQIDDMEEPSLSAFYPRSLIVTNSEFGKAWQISRNAIDDDQVGQFARMPAMIGEQHRNLEEIYFSAFLTGVNQTLEGVSVPVPTYNDPDGTKGFYTTATTSPDRQNAITPSVFSQQSFSDLLVVSKKIKDPGGKTLLIKPNYMFGGTNVSMTANAVLNSTFWPSAMSGAATPTQTGSFNTVNPIDPKWGVLRAAIQYFEVPYFNGTSDLAGSNSSKNWWGFQEVKKNGIIQQVRQPLEVLMEAPNNGPSIRTKSYYYRTDQRYAFYHGDARFCFRGSDGSV
jgi:hypothetical protein